MDVLHFMKEEYLAVKEELPLLAPSDLLEGLAGARLKRFMVRIELMVRVGGELILPELMDFDQAAASVAMLAEDQLKGLARIVAGFKKTGVIADQKRSEVFRKVSAHVEQMERAVLPLIRELLPTAVREDIGEIAIDYREDLRLRGTSLGSRGPVKAGRLKAASTISA